MGTMSAQLIDGVGLGICLLWFGALLAPTGWHTRMDALVSFDIGLYKVDASRGTVATFTKHMQWESPKVKKFVDDMMTGKGTIRDTREGVCHVFNAIAPEMCNIWQRLEYSSMFMLACGFVGILALMIGIGYQHYYWHFEARKKIRGWATIGLFLGPGIIAMGMMTYTWGTSYLARFSTLQLTQGVLNAPKSVTFSKIYFLSVALTMASFIPGLIHIMFSGTSPVEIVNEEICERKHMAEDMENQQYLNSQVGGAGQAGYGSTNQMPPQAGMQYGGPPGSAGYGPQPGYGGYGGAPPPPGAYPGGGQQGYNEGFANPAFGGGMPPPPPM